MSWPKVRPDDENCLVWCLHQAGPHSTGLITTEINTCLRIK